MRGGKSFPETWSALFSLNLSHDEQREIAAALTTSRREALFLRHVERHLAQEAAHTIYRSRAETAFEAGPDAKLVDKVAGMKRRKGLSDEQQEGLDRLRGEMQSAPHR